MSFLTCYGSQMVYPPLSTDLRVDIAQEVLFGLLGDVVLPHLHLQQLEQLAAGEAALPVGRWWATLVFVRWP